MISLKKILIDFFNLCFPPDNESQEPKNYELVIFYSVVILLLIVGVAFLR